VREWSSSDIAQQNNGDAILSNEGPQNDHNENSIHLPRRHSIGRVRSCVRPVDAARMDAGPNALRGSVHRKARSHVELTLKSAFL
jgi:hypothetical protein